MLHTYRRTLAIYLRQAAALGGIAHCPPAVVGGIDEARRNIARIKVVLRRAGVEVADDPDDVAVDEWAAPPPKRVDATPLATRPPPGRPRSWLVLAAAGLAMLAVLVPVMHTHTGGALGLPLGAASPPPTQVATMLGRAVEPTLADGQQVTIELVAPDALRRGDVVLISPYGEAPSFKRIIGMPGESVGIQDGRVYINDELLEEPYVLGSPTTCRTDPPACGADLMKGTVYVLGDNRANSKDSREFAP